MTRNILSTVRFIDDGAGIFKGSEREFKNWKKTLTEGLKNYGLTIKEKDWDVALKHGDTVHILDVKFSFDVQAKLVTDLYQKETDKQTR